MGGGGWEVEREWEGGDEGSQLRHCGSACVDAGEEEV